MSQSRYNSLKAVNAMSTNVEQGIESPAMARKRLVDYFDWLIEAHTLLRKQHKESEEPVNDEDIHRLLQLHPMGAKNSSARGRSNETNSEDQ